MSRSKKVAGDAAASAANLRQLVQAAKAIGHPARLRILAMLNGGTLCVCQMTSMLAVAPSTVSGHLNELRRSGLVLEDKQGKLVYYRLDDRSPFVNLVADTLALAASDETVLRDRALIDRVRAVPVEVLTRAGLRLDRVGIKRSTLRSASIARARRPARPSKRRAVPSGSGGHP